MEAVEKEDIIEENTKDILNMKVFEKICNDFEDEIITKDEKILDLENMFKSNSKDDEEPIQPSLEEELLGPSGNNSALEAKILTLESDLKIFKAK